MSIIENILSLVGCNPHQTGGNMNEKKNPTQHKGSCHCGAVRYEVSIDATSGGRCNCTICTKIGYLGSNVKPADFKLIAGKESLGEYVWGSRIGARHFCKQCGVHCFGTGNLPELGGEFVSINYNTLDDVDQGKVSTYHWDGRHNNWHAGPRDAAWPIFTANQPTV
jgi:hypothetical protein